MRYQFTNMKYNQDYTYKILIFINTIINKHSNKQQTQHNTNPKMKQQPNQLPSPQPQKQEQPKIQSSAYPAQKKIQNKSVFHKILKKSLTKTNNITMRTSVKDSDIVEIRHLQLEWFPLRYDDSFYDRLLTAQYKCLITEMDVVIGWDQLRLILKDKYEKQYELFVKQNKNSGKSVLKQPSKYFINQGVEVGYLLDIYDYNLINPILKTKSPCKQNQPQKQPLTQTQYETDSKKPQLVKVKIIIGVMVFDLVTSKGYLGGQWWKQKIFGWNNSVYINTIGVIPQCRKSGIAKRMLEWLISRIEKQKFFKLLYLHVIQYNEPAIQLYKKHGFKQLGVCNNYYTIDNKGYNAIALGVYLNGGKRQVGWAEWIGSFWS